MSGYRLTRSAEEDLAAIIDYIATDSPRAAAKVRAKLYRAFDHLGAFPGTGHSREDLTSKAVLFFTIMGAFSIIYRGDRRPIEIVNVVRAGRDIGALLG